jgi:tRNA-5-methyluridine54 2-sulfurtransferase
MKCSRCREPAVVALPSHHAGFCAPCFDIFALRQVERAIKKHSLLLPDDRILVALSGGKDSLALMHMLHRLGYTATGLHLDLGIDDSSEYARASVEAFCAGHGFPLIVHEFAAQGIAIPLVRKTIKRPVCAVCGKLKRHTFNRLAREHGFTVLATGHNLDDEVGRLFANVLRWDRAYLADQGPLLPAEEGFVRKIKPLYRLTEFELANYCFLQGIEHHMRGCPFSKGASFSAHKELWEELESHSPGQKLSFYETFLKTGRPVFENLEQQEGASLNPCDVCGSPTSAEVCSVCRIAAQVRGQARQ